MTPELHVRIKKIFLEVREHPVEERDAYLARRCGGDDELEHEIRSLLQRDRDDTETGIEAAEDDLATPPLRGGAASLKIANYRVLQKIGEGGMGEVYEAEQLHPMRRRLALKVLKSGLATKEVVARFESERQALAMMNHPNIARVLEAGATENERPYLAMELVHGEPITDYCDRHRLSTGDRLELFVEACAGVQHAHQKGIIHRDIKPSNVLVAMEDGRAVPKIIDFGVAKATAQRLTEHTLFTQQGQWIGTPEYMSPEQAEMTGLDIDTRTDVYSLGVLLYELLVGARPFDSTELRRAGLDEVRRRIREEDPTRPSTKVSRLGDASQTAAHNRQADLESLVQQLRGDLDWITMKALDKDRTRRYVSPSELAADIRRHLADEPVVACPPSALYKCKKFVRRNRLAVFAAGLITASLLLGLVMTGLALKRARLEAQRANQVSGFLIDLFDAFNPYTGRSEISGERMLDQAVERLETELAGQDLEQARLMYRIGVAYRHLDAFESGEALLRRARVGLEAELGRDHPEVITTLQELGWLAYEAGNYPRAEQYHEEAIALQNASLEPGDPRLALGKTNLGLVVWALGEFDRAEEILTRAQATLEQAYGPNDPELSQNLFLQGVLFNNTGDYRRAHSVLQRALQVRLDVFGPEHVRVGWTLRTLARTQTKQGDYSQALETGRRALEIMEKSLGPAHSDNAFPWETLGTIHRQLGNFSQARPLLERSLSVRENSLGPEHVEVGLSLIALSLLYLDSDDPATAGPLIERALAIDRRHRPPTHPQIAWDLHTLSRQRRALGLRDEALALQLEALEILEDFGSEHPLLAPHLANHGALLRETGDLPAARPWLEGALSLREKQLGPTHRLITADLRELALLEEAAGEEATADRHFERALAMSQTALGPDHPAVARCLRDYAGFLQRSGRPAEATDAERRAASIEARWQP